MSTPTDLAENPPAAGGAPQGKSTTIRTGRAISVVFFLGVAVRLFTLVSQTLIASIFGTSREMDAYTLALIVPVTIASVLAVAVGAAIIPIFIEYRERRSDAEAMRLLWAVTSLGTLVALIVTGLMMSAAPLLIAVFASHVDAPTQALATTLLRFLAPIILFQGLSTLLGAILNVYNRFVASSLLPAANAICIVGFLLLFHHAWGIYALGWGTLAGYIVNFLLLVVACLHIGLRFRLVLDWHHPGVRRIAVIVFPAFIGSMLANVNILVDQFMAGFLPAGSISSLSYAVKLVDTPSQFFYSALYTALLPIFSIQVARGDLDALRKTFRQTVILSAMVLLPLGVLLGVLSRPVVQLLYQHGKFTGASTDLVAGAMLVLAPSMFFVTYAFINARAYQALQDNWTLRNVAVLSLLLNGVLDYLFMQFWGVAGIAFSTTLTYILTAVVLLVILDRKLQGLQLQQIGLAVGKATCASGLIWLICALLEQSTIIERLPPLLQLIGLGLLGIAIYPALLWVLRVRELGDLWAMLRSRLPIGRRAARPAQ